MPQISTTYIQKLTIPYTTNKSSEKKDQDMVFSINPDISLYIDQHIGGPYEFTHNLISEFESHYSLNMQ